ncbi:two-component system sensor histidine kinase PmrB [Tatumella saanichensis]|uniref:two-component system sensor histidine kinase PmrB n=1 Tax=Tatumella saanichensis TaxID=480813 RepID=UPI0004BB18D9|nr:two-component system sensor histidine kinase PmrB [Tatumella saanichensis]
MRRPLILKPLARTVTLRSQLLITLGTILLSCQVISVIWLWHESKEQISLLVESIVAHQNERWHVREEIHEAVASLAIPSLIMISLALLLCWQAIRRVTRPLSELRYQLERHSAFNAQPIRYQSTVTEVDAVIHSINDMVARLTETLDRERLFTADVAHELRTPLAGLRLHLELIARQYSLDMQPLIQRLDQMTNSVSQLLQLARIGQSFSAGHYQEVQLTSHVTAPMRDSLLTLIKLRHQQLFLPTSDPQMVVKGDHTLLQLVVRNLTENAHRYSPEYSSITISLHRSMDEQGQPQIELRIEDEGPGIDETRAWELSRPFVRLDSGYGGSGLGLSIVNRICQMHNARFSLSNRLDRSGCRASVFFNAATETNWPKTRHTEK